MITYTSVFNKVKRSDYGAGCDIQKILVYGIDFVYIPETNECFRKSLENIYQKRYIQENCEFIKQLDRCENIKSQARNQPFCRKNNLNLGVYNLKQKTILPRSVTERGVCLYIHSNHFCVIRKTAQSSFPDAIDELEKNFKYESNEITDDNLRQVIDVQISYII